MNRFPVRLKGPFSGGPISGRQVARRAEPRLARTPRYGMLPDGVNTGLVGDELSKIAARARRRRERRENRERVRAEPRRHVRKKSDGSQRCCRCSKGSHAEAMEHMKTVVARTLGEDRLLAAELLEHLGGAK